MAKDVKKFSLTAEEIAELVFYAKEQKVREIEAKMWDQQLKFVELRIAKRLGMDSKEFSFDWNKAMQTGELQVQKIEQPKVILGNEETKPNESGNK